MTAEVSRFMGAADLSLARGLLAVLEESATDVDPTAALFLGLLLLLAGAALLFWLLPLIERVLCRGLGPEEEPQIWGGTELLVMVGVTFVGINLWYGILQALGEETAIDALLATDLALLSAVVVGALMALRRGAQGSLPARPGALSRGLGLGAAVPGTRAKSLLLAGLTLALATPAILGVMNLWPLLLSAFGREAAAQDVLLDVLSQRGVGLGIALVLASFVGPALEELFFRGFLQPVLRGRVGSGASILLTSLLFASIHGLDASGPVFCLSLVLCYLRERTGRLESAILAHCLWNGTTLALSLTLGP